MTRLIALYPRAWRLRYEDELLALMAERSPGPLDRLDIVRGAIDARLHPELTDAPQSPRPRSRAAVATGALVASAGLGWLAWLGSILMYFRGWGSGMPEHADLMVLVAFLGFLAMSAAIAAIAATFIDAIRPIGRLGLMLAAIGFVLTAIGGGLSIVVGFAGVIVVAWSMAGIIIPRWLAAGWIATTLLAFLAMVMFVVGDGRDVGLLALGIPYGIAWLLIGLAIAARRPPLTAPLTASPA